jgi:hypothetical protein
MFKIKFIDLSEDRISRYVPIFLFNEPFFKINDKILFEHHINFELGLNGDDVKQH